MEMNIKDEVKTEPEYSDENDVNGKNDVNSVDRAHARCQRINDEVFADAIDKFGRVLLKKGWTPTIKTKKLRALNLIMTFLNRQKGIVLNERQIFKKLNNMKTKVKTKNESILNAGQKKLLKMMDETEDNQAVSRLSVGVTAGVSTARQNLELNGHNICASRQFNAAPSSTTSISDCDAIPTIAHFSMRQAENNIIPGKKDETKTTDLQRMVLLKQLELFEVQKKFYERFEETLSKVQHLVELHTKTYEPEVRKM